MTHHHQIYVIGLNIAIHSVVASQLPPIINSEYCQDNLTFIPGN